MSGSRERFGDVYSSESARPTGEARRYNSRSACIAHEDAPPEYGICQDGNHDRKRMNG
jgi:hypothetical protein